MSKWDQRFLALRPSAAKVFAIAWQRKIDDLLRQQGSEALDGELLYKAFTVTVEESSSLPIRDKVYRLITLRCAISLLALYHPHGNTVDRTERARGWSDQIWGRYLSLLRRHGIVISYS